MGQLLYSFDEKRDFIRMQMHTPARIETEEGQLIEGLCKDLSGGGLLVELPEALPLDSGLNVEIISHNHQFPGLQAHCTVARIEAHSNGSYSTGLAIREILQHPASEVEMTE